MSDHLWYANPRFGLFCCLKKSSFLLPENQNKNSNSNFMCMLTVKDNLGKYKTSPGRRGLSLCWLAESCSFLVMFASAVRWVFCCMASFCRMAQPPQKEYEMFKLAYGWNTRVSVLRYGALSAKPSLCRPTTQELWWTALTRPSCAAQECTLSQLSAPNWVYSCVSAALSVGPDPWAITDLRHQAAWWSTGAEVLVVP